MAGNDRGNPDLKQVKDELFRLANVLSNMQQPTDSLASPAENQPQLTSQISHTRVTTAPSSSTISSSALLEQRRLFNFGKRPNTSSSSKTKSVKKRKQVTYTIKFVCLPSKNAIKPPTSVKERTDLANSSLGEKRLTFAENEYVYATILEKYPQLSEVGGFDFLLYQRGGGSDAGFHIIKPPHSASRLKDLCGQAKIYLRPIQKDIPVKLESTSGLESELSMEGETSLIDMSPATIDEPVLQCFVCGMDIPFSSIREHTETHNIHNKTSSSKRQTTIDETTSNRSLDDTHSVETIQEILPSVSDTEIQSALSSVNWDVAEAVEQLLPDIVDVGNCSDNDDQLLITAFGEDRIGDVDEITTSMAALKLYRKANLDENQPKQRVFLSRIDGINHLKRDVIGFYKNPSTKLKAGLRVRFEEEDAVGNGPIREFLAIVVDILDEGIYSSGSKRLLFFEGQADHRVPVHNQSLRLTGTYKVLGKMIGHSVLHGGPGLHGMSPAVKSYLSSDQSSTDAQSLPVTIEDVPDIELRQMIAELDSVPSEESIKPDLRTTLEPYMYEAGLDPDELNSRRKIIIHGLIMYQAIDKRRLELDELAKGMEEVSLVSFLKRAPVFKDAVFPTDAERYVLAQTVLDALSFEHEDASEENKKTAEFFVTYVKEIEARNSGSAKLIDLISFWTAGNVIGYNSELLLVKFNDDRDGILPMAETCFMGIILPTVHKSYEDFKKNMDIALTYGSKGFDFT